MNPDNQLAASFWLMVVLQTIGSVDMPGQGGRKMPAPGVYVPIVIVWSVLQLLSDAGLQRGARVAGWVTLLAGAVVGPFGTKAVGLLTGASKFYGTGPGVAGASATVTPQNVNA